MTCSEFDQLLDSYIDGELDEAQRKALEDHAAQCARCGESLMAARQLREILSHMDDDIAVPLPAQAAWRSAVRAEAKRGRMKKIYTAIGAVAAACVLTFGVSTMMKAEVPGEVVPQVARIEADSVSENSDLAGESVMRRAIVPELDDYFENTVAVEDFDQACKYLEDICAEYGAMIEYEVESDEGKKIYLQVPGEVVNEFIGVVDGTIGVAQGDYNLDTAPELVGVCISMIGA